jgi:hypothetical protein
MYTLNSQEYFSWPLRVYILNSREGLPAVKGVPSAAGIDSHFLGFGIPLSSFWESISQDRKIIGDLTPKPADGLGDQLPIIRECRWKLGALGVDSPRPNDYYHNFKNVQKCRGKK